MSSYLDEDVNKDGTGAPIGTSTTPANPSNSLNPSVGIKFPQLANPEIRPRKKKPKMTEQKSMNSGADEVGCTPDSPDCKDVNCAKCMNKSMNADNNELGCTADSAKCGDAMCTKCMNKALFTNFGKDYTKSQAIDFFQ